MKQYWRRAAVCGSSAVEEPQTGNRAEEDLFHKQDSNVLYLHYTIY